MEQKSIYMIEQSIKLFAKKGFNSTSVQEIANECGISKGAFYLHFKSKDALLFEIFRYYFNRIQVRIDDIQKLDVDDRTKFTKQLQVTLEELAEHREFIIMQVREQTIPFNENIDEFLKQMRLNSYLFYKKHLMNIYGERIQGVLWEVSLLLQGIFKGYIDLIIIEDAHFDFNTLSQAILRRADYIVEGFERSGDQPVIDDKYMRQIIPEAFKNNEKGEILFKLQGIQDDNHEEIRDTATILMEELQRESPRSAVLKGMLVNLEEKYKQLTEQIRSLYNL